MRSAAAEQYSECRDALARDWYRVFAALNWQTNWMLIPNLGVEIAHYIKAWQIDAFILTGGEDVGIDPQRDDTETTILTVAEREQLPVLGICRGMQLIQRYEHGTFTSDPSHVATPHQVRLDRKFFQLGNRVDHIVSVNSYHRNCINLPLPARLRSIATAGAQCEGFQHRILPWVGVMWHPERQAELSSYDLLLLRWLEGVSIK